MNTRLVVYRPTLTNSGVLINNPGSTYPVSASETVIAVDTVDASTVFVANDSLVDNAGVVYGVIKSVDSATAITLFSVSVAIPDNASLFYTPNTPYEIDLEKAPNVRINYNWLDVKEPENRKSNFSQTIKIPFTNENNKFFENWFNVNLDTLIYNTKTKYKAVILVDSIPQLDGYIQLKSIYLNARLYEVIVFGDTANFFADIKSKKLRDAFINEDGTVDQQLDHKNTLANIKASYTTGLTTLDSVVDNDIMYPIIDYGHTNLPLCDSMFWNPDYLDPLNENMGNYTNLQENANYYGLVQSQNLKPAIRIQRLLKIIAQKAGYQITSSFLGLTGDTQDKSTFFGKQFMTLAPQYERTRVKIYNGFSASISSAITDTTMGYNISATGFANQLYVNGFQFDTITFNDNNIYSNTMPFGSVGPTLNIPYDPDTPGVLPAGGITIQTDLEVVTSPTTLSGSDIDGYNVVLTWFLGNGEFYAEQSISINPGVVAPVQFISEISTSVLISGYVYAELYFYPTNDIGNEAFAAQVNSGTMQTINNEGIYNNGGVNAEVQIVENLPDLTQSDFVKDLLNRYNLIVMSDPQNAKNLIIEPYQDYIDGGSIQYWTDKLDVLKEQTLRTTNELQKRELLYTDLESKDYLNKSYTDKWSRVWGSVKQLNTNDFAKGNFKTPSIYAPYIAQGIGHWTNNMANMSANDEVAIAFNFEVDSDGNRNPITDGKPMLFFYGGTPITLTDLNDQWNNDWEFNLISGAYTLYGDTETLSMDNKFPLCLPYDMNTISDITASTKMLHWEYYKPQFITGFTFNIFGEGVTNHGYYLDYWAQYINEIYSDEARIMECYLDLNETDIHNFKFQNPIYLKNTLWRILSVENYVVGGKETTKVKLLKAISKLNYDCAVTPSLFNLNGTITFIDPTDGSTADVTNACCEELNPNWTFQQTNATTGVGICYHNSSTYTSTQNGSGVNNGTNLNNLSGVLGDNQMLAMPPMPIQNSATNIITRNNGLSAQESTFYLQCVTNGNTAENLRQQNVNDRVVSLPLGSMTYVNIELMGTIVAGTTGFIGKVGFFEYYTVLVSPFNEVKTFSGPSGGTKEKEVRDNDFPEPTVNITTYDADFNYVKLSVTHSGDNVTRWLAKVKLLIQPLGNSETPLLQRAIYQNGNGILFQNTGMLLWN